MRWRDFAAARWEPRRPGIVAPMSQDKITETIDRAIAQQANAVVMTLNSGVRVKFHLTGPWALPEREIRQRAAGMAGDMYGIVIE